MTQRRQVEIAGVFRNPTIGELDKRALFRTREDVPTDDGTVGVQAVYTEMFRTWCRLAPVGESVRIGSEQIDNAVTHKIIIRYREGITTDYEIVIDGLAYRVKGTVGLNGKKQFLVVSAEELGVDDGII
ncbi:phage head closure protein [Sodalis sp. RH24]|uniref:phage head closure protein n=1 Tax=unclassified Sodalis (in: enterobacteria) TaxID=2636512 RepID=UPI0039B68162